MEATESDPSHFTTKYGKKVFEKEGALGLFHLFLTKSFFNTIVEWTTQKCVLLAKPTISKEDFPKYLGLELAISLSHHNSIQDYWSNKAFIGVKVFQDVTNSRRLGPLCSLDPWGWIH